MKAREIASLSLLGWQPPCAGVCGTTCLLPSHPDPARPLSGAALVDLGEDSVLKGPTSFAGRSELPRPLCPLRTALTDQSWAP